MACSAALALTSGLAVQASAQEGFTPDRATAYEEVLQLPDWAGIWYPDWTLLFSTRAVPPVLTPAAQEAFNAYQASISEHGPSQEAQAQCLPPGIPGTLQQPYPIEILFSPGRTTILTEAYEQIFRIYTDGRPLPEDPDPFFKGNITGFWDGDTLVFDVVGLHPSTNISAGIPHTEKSRVHGHIYLQAEDQLMIEMTITNPDVLARPYVTRIAFKQDDEFPIREYVCAENNRLESGEGGANIDLGFDVLDESN
ncbi:hypothetical protein [Alteraurantiacibacter aquimixticola]|uniref:Intradiol ring-cleavage dioxygenases domain-containing protein n=1 Tax=Alteraurantiacibacter aquimixticola TaxID=2489173 RepID=A0A4V4U897_9SPHN|nr:hypothetical protein [Alteraurantiacibacter aquimixticola]TIX49077.1 hypothetical protein E5222_15225 [Alteraurantiacibacter aquimixticola]